MDVADAAGGVTSVDTPRFASIATSLSLLLHAAAVAVVMLLDTVAGVVVSVSIEAIFALVVLVRTSHPSLSW